MKKDDSAEAPTAATAAMWLVQYGRISFQYHVTSSRGASEAKNSVLFLTYNWYLLPNKENAGHTELLFQDCD